MPRLIFMLVTVNLRPRVLISSGDVLNGDLPRRAIGLIKDWVRLHREEREADWTRSQAGEPLVTIDPRP